MESYSALGEVRTSSESMGQEDETEKSVVDKEESGNCCGVGEVVEGRTLPLFTVSAPRDFGRVLGAAAENWYASGDDRSTYGRGYDTTIPRSTRWYQDFRTTVGVGYNYIIGLFLEVY